MLNIDILKNVLIVSLASSIISTSLIQRIKEERCTTKYICFYSFFISISIGIFFSLSFSKLSFIYSLWVGLISFIGADGVYKLFEDKIFKSNTTINNVIDIDREENNDF